MATCIYDCDKCGKTYRDDLYPDNPEDCCVCPDCGARVVCPFCGEKDFDLSGLKGHFLAGYCDKYNEVKP